VIYQQPDFEEVISYFKGTSVPSRELDGRLWCALQGTNFELFRAVVPSCEQWQSPFYSYSVELALSSIPTEWRPLSLEWRSGQVHTKLIRGSETLEHIVNGLSLNPAISVCIASLYAWQFERAGQQP